MEYTGFSYDHKLPQGYQKQYREYITEFTKAVNKWDYLLTEEYTSKIQNYLWIYQAFYYKNLKNCKDYRNFTVDLHQYFTRLNQNALGITSKTHFNDFEFMNIDFADADKMGAEAILDLNYSKWRKHNEPNN